MEKYLIFSLFIVLGCTSRETRVYQPRQVDTLSFGSYYKTSLPDVWGYHLRTTSDMEVAYLLNDTMFTMKVEFDHVKYFPVKLISMNQNVFIEPLAGKVNQFKLWIKKKTNEPDCFDAKLIVVADTIKRSFLYHRREWTDSLKTGYKDYYFRLDTLSRESIKIKERPIGPSNGRGIAQSAWFAVGFGTLAFIK